MLFRSVNNQLVVVAPSPTNEGGQIVLAWPNISGITGQANSTWNIDVDGSNDFRVFYQNAVGSTSVPFKITQTNGNVTVAGNLLASNYYWANGVALTTIIDSVSNAISVVSQAVSVETANRTSADNALSVRIDTVSNAVSVVSQALSVETANRVSAVNVVSNALSVEIANRTSADNALSNLISALSNSVSVTYAPKANATFTGTTNIATLNVSGDTVLTGNLTVNGSVETINSTTVTINDKNILIANNASTSATIDGAGIDVGTGPVTYLRYIHANLGWYTANNFGVGGTLTVAGTNVIAAIDTVSNAEIGRAHV